MELKVQQIVFLASGKLSVEVSGGSDRNPPIPPVLDNVRFRVYMEYTPTDTIEKINEMAIRIASESMRVGKC